tara:strand:- start:569 stop:1147 length:579 start_codon:yes stop_codon:yes gene_type:complete
MYAEIMMGLSLFAGYMGAQAKREGAYAQGDEYFTMGDETIATAKTNIRKMDESRYLTELDILEKTQQEINFASDQGRRDYATMESDFSSRGAVLSEGTPMEALANQALQSSQREIGIAQSARKGIGALRYQTKKGQESTMRTARTRANQYYRQGQMAYDSAENMFMANMLGSFIGAGSSYAQMPDSSKYFTS